MVFTSVVNYVAKWHHEISHKLIKPPRIWRRRRIFRLSAHYYDRSRNCYRIALRRVYRALTYSTKSRALKKKDTKALWERRLAGACEEHGITFRILLDGLRRSEIYLNRKTLGDLAIWEPRTFKALTRFAWTRAEEEGLNGLHKVGKAPDGVLTRNMIKLK